MYRSPALSDYSLIVKMLCTIPFTMISTHFPRRMLGKLKILNACSGLGGPESTVRATREFIGSFPEESAREIETILLSRASSLLTRLH